MGISELRSKAVEIVDEKTRQIIARGFSFDGNQFSLSIEAQKNFLWMYVLFLRGALLDGTSITTMDDNAYPLRTAKMLGFFDSANNAVAFALSSGRDLKDKIVNSNDEKFLETFYDPRE